MFLGEKPDFAWVSKERLRHFETGRAQCMPPKMHKKYKSVMKALKMADEINNDPRDMAPEVQQRLRTDASKMLGELDAVLQQQRLFIRCGHTPPPLRRSMLLACSTSQFLTWCSRAFATGRRHIASSGCSTRACYRRMLRLRRTFRSGSADLIAGAGAVRLCACASTFVYSQDKTCTAFVTNRSYMYM